MQHEADLEFVSTEDLIVELAERHSEIIIIREKKKCEDTDRVFVKTGFGEKGRVDKGFDLIEATQMLHAAHLQLIYDYLEKVTI